MFRFVSDFTAAWEREAASTARLLEALSDTALATRMDAGGRTLGRVAWHLVETLAEMLPAAGLAVDFAVDPEAVPDRAAEIAAAYREGASRVGAVVVASWSDADLAGEVPMYGESWARGFVLQCLVLHQAHHRGQLTVLMRQAGLAVPGMVGPSREEWAAMGMPAQA